MPQLTASSLTEGGKVGGMKVPPPQADSYQQSAATSGAAVRTQTATLGHNLFRPDVYKVSEGYLS